MNYKAKFSSKKWVWGFSLAELLVVMGIIAILGTITLVGLSGRRSESELRSVAQHIALLLREAQNRSVSQVSGTTWGVHFENNTSTPFYALFSNSYSPSTTVGSYRLYPSLSYATSTLPLGTSKEVTFSGLQGLVSASTSIGVLITATPTHNYLITIASSGAVSF